MELFAESLHNLSERTVGRHISNVAFYLNDFLMYDEARSFDQGIWMIGNFLGDFFIRKCMWSTPGTIKSPAVSIKKFYKCMLDHEMIQKADYEYLCETIKEDMPQWQEICEQYNDGNEENPFFPF